MLGFIYHHKSFPDDLRADIEFTLKRCIRDGVAQDAHVVDQILSYKTSEAPASSPAASGQKKQAAGLAPLRPANAGRGQGLLIQHVYFSC